MLDWLFRRRAPEPAVSSKDVNRALREIVWPALREEGFSRRTARTAWRDRAEQVDVVNFQSFNAYLADGLDCTTFSFAVNLGVYPRCLHDIDSRVKEKDGHLRPEEWQCGFRLSLERRVDQGEIDRRDIWFVRPDGANITTVVHDARDVIREEGLPWFDRLDGVERMRAVARAVPASMKGTWGISTTVITALETAYVSASATEPNA